jgi:small GTP-binding protein
MNNFEMVSSEGESGNNINHSIEEMKKENNDIIFREISLLEKDDFFNLILDINKNLSIYKKEKRLNNDIVNYVKFNENIIDMTKFRKKDIIVLKGILLGHTNVGKTTFFRYIQKKEYTEFLSTIGIDSLTLNAEINKENVLFELFDTAGQERYESISKNYYKQVDGILFFFDVTNEESFKRIDKWIKNIEESENMNNFEMILIGNKIDKNEERKISKKEAKEKANKYGMKYFESCCLNGLNIYELLNEIIFSAYNKYYEKESRGIKKRNSNTLKNSINVKKEYKRKGGCCNL